MSYLPNSHRMTISPARSLRRPLLVGLLIGLLLTGWLLRLQAEDSFAYRYEKYQEDSGRIAVESHLGQFDVTLAPWLAFKGQVVNDAVSGATPTGLPTTALIPTNSYAAGIWDDSYAKAHMKENRMAGYGEPTFTFGPNRVSIEFSYSGESDYISRGLALNYSREFNNKNTTLNLGWSHNFDTVERGASPYGQLFLDGNGNFRNLKKDADEFIVGVNQLLDPKTVLTANYEMGYENGYLGDPYKGFLFYDGSGNPEKVPGQRLKEIGYVQLTHYVTDWAGSVEASYRLYHDSYGIFAHTVTLAWYQKLGKSLVISPLFRFYSQSAASFYHLTLPGYVGPVQVSPGDPTPLDNNPQPVIPSYYSADYRLSDMQTFSGEINLRWKVVNHFSLEASYERYVMMGTDGQTPAWVYPNANVFTVGAEVTF